MAHARQFHITGWPLIVLAPILVPIGLVIMLIERVTGTDKAELSAEEAVAYLDDFIEGRGGDWDWDDFTSIPLKAPTLEAIRNEAELVVLPVTTEGLERLKVLRARAKALCESDTGADEKPRRPS